MNLHFNNVNKNFNNFMLKEKKEKLELEFEHRHRRRKWFESRHPLDPIAIRNYTELQYQPSFQGSADTYIPTRSTHTFALTRLLGCNYVCTDRRGRKGTPTVSPWDALYMYKAVYRPPSGVANGRKGLGRRETGRLINNIISR